MDRQLLNHLGTITKIMLMGRGAMLTKCLYTVNMGNNDFINNYFLPKYYPTSSIYTPEEYANVLIRQYALQLKTLYTYGARKVVVFGVGLIGCTLGEIYIHGATNGSTCVDGINHAADLFNGKLISLVDRLNAQLYGAQFTYINTASSDTGSAIVDKPCCDVRNDFQCQKSIAPCAERETYIFWDGYHTTEMANIATAESSFNAIDQASVHPMDINTLLSNDAASINQKIVTSDISATK